MTVAETRILQRNRERLRTLRLTLPLPECDCWACRRMRYLEGNG